MAGYICKIGIEDTHPPVWRRIVIPDKITFQELHEIIQVLFGWEDEHLHEFRVPSDHICIDNEDDSWGEHYDESETLIDPFFRNYKWIRYTYDFGDDWRHRINIEQADTDYAERYATLMKFKGDNFWEDSGGVWEVGDDARRVFDREGVEKRLKHMAFPIHEELQEIKLLKESAAELWDMFQTISGLKPEIRSSVMAEALQKMGNKVSIMTRKLEEWESFDEEGAEKGNILELISPSKSQKELLLDLGEKEAADYYKYLRLPQVKMLTREQKVSAVSETLQDHPEYLFYVFDEDEYRDLTEWIRYPQGTVSKRPQSKSLLIKVFALGLGDFVRKEGHGEISFASDIDKFVGVVDARTKKKTYRNLKEFDDRMEKLLQVYGVVELENLYEIYQNLYKKNWEKESFFRYIYWHARFNDFVNTVYQLDGTCYVASKDLDPKRIIGKMKDYAKQLPYAAYSVREIDYKAEDLSNRSEWMDILFTTLHYQLRMNTDDAQYWLIETVLAILNGDTSDQLIEMLKTESRQTWSIEVAAEIWTVISGLMLDLELPMLKGRCRRQYAREQGCSVWTVGMVSDSVDIKNAKTRHMYQFPAEVQEWMYEAESYGLDDIIKQLFNYKEQNHICSEEYLYLLAETCIILGQTKKAEQLICELKTSSSDGKKAAKSLEGWLRERYDVMDDDADWFEDDGWNQGDQRKAQQPYVRTAPKIGRNDPCPCGSGKKYKKCCGRRR